MFISIDPGDFLMTNAVFNMEQADCCRSSLACNETAKIPLIIVELGYDSSVLISVLILRWFNHPDINVEA